jgi:hypothetical protein
MKAYPQRAVVSATPREVPKQLELGPDWSTLRLECGHSTAGRRKDKQAGCYACWKQEQPLSKTLGQEETEANQELLSCMLQLAVPLWVQRFIDEGKTLDELMRIGPEVADHLGPGGAALMWRTKGRPAGTYGKGPDASPRPMEPGTADMFNLLAKGIAAASFNPGGFEFHGQRWESKPEWLRPRGEAAHV